MARRTLHGTRFLISEATFGELGDDVIVGRTISCELPGKAGEHTLIEVLGTRPGARVDQTY